MPASYCFIDMRHKLLLIASFTFLCFITKAQILYSERFNSLSLNTGTYSSGGSTHTYLFNDLPFGMFTINNGSLVADTLTGNYPFRANGQKKKAWLSYKEANQLDTFAVSTSWLNPTGVADAWMITPTINSIAPNTVLSWESIAPDAINADGFEVYVTTNTSTIPVVSDFTPSNKVFSTTSESYSWQTHGISLGAYAGQNIRIAFRNNSNNKYQLWIDDIIVQNIPLAFDVATTVNNTYKYSAVAINNIISATFKNNAYTPISTLSINYKMGANPTITETKTLTTLMSYLESRNLSFSVPYITSTPVYNDLKIWVSAINGSTDQLHSNDTIMGSLTISSNVPAKKVFIEEYTGAWCGWCPDGYTKLNSIASTNTNVVVASLHSSDNMNSAPINTLVTDYVSVFPSATFDQYNFTSKPNVSVERAYWDSSIIKRAAMVVPATVTITGVSYNALTREINATVSSSFLGDVKGDYRLNLYIKENNVYGAIADSMIDNNWNQHSYLYNIPSSPFYQYGNYLNPTTFLMGSNRYKHQYVVNSMVDGAYGAAGIIPLSASTIGQTYSKAYTYTLSTPVGTEFRYNADNIYLIGVLTEYNSNTKQRAVLNVAEVKLNSQPEMTVGLKEMLSYDFKMNIFPNPTSNQCKLNYMLKENELVTVSVYNTLGEQVYTSTKFENAGLVTNELYVINLQQGNYSVEVSTKQFKATKKLTIIK